MIAIAAALGMLASYLGLMHLLSRRACRRAR